MPSRTCGFFKLLIRTSLGLFLALAGATFLLGGNAPERAPSDKPTVRDSLANWDGFQSHWPKPAGTPGTALPTVQPPSRHPTAPPDTADEGGARDTLTPEEALRLVENRLEAERKLKTGLWVLAIMTILIQFFLIYISTYWFIKGARKLIPSMRGMSEAEKKLRNKRRWAMILGLLILAIPLVLTAFLVQWAFLGPVINDAFVGLVLILLILLFPLAPALGLLLSFIYTNDLIELLKKRRNQLREKVK